MYTAVCVAPQLHTLQCITQYQVIATVYADFGAAA